MTFFETVSQRPERDFQKACLGLSWDSLSSPADLPDTLLLHEDRKYKVFYAPMGLTIPDNAKLLIVGLTPGWAQAREAYKQFLAAEGDLKNYRSLAKSIAFKGSMRTGILNFLNRLQIPQALGLEADTLFQSDRLATTSILRYPVFKASNHANYSGNTDALHHPFLKAMVEGPFREVVQRSPHALIVPMGKWPGLAITALAATDPTLQERTLFGFPHMSGANAGRREPAFKEFGQGWEAIVKQWSKTL